MWAQESNMGIFSRFTDIVNSNINAILDKAEEPEKIIRLIIQEMEDTLVEVRSAAAQAIADKKDIARKLQALDADANDWQAKAELALDKGREDLAKAALGERAIALRTAESLQEAARELSESLDKLNDDIASLQEKLSDAKARQKALVARHQTTNNRLRVRKRLHDYRIDDALLRFETFERRIDYLEGHVESYELGGQRNLANEISELEADEAIEQELQALKASRAQQTSSDPGD
jgi:phage shock protein A